MKKYLSFLLLLFICTSGFGQVSLQYYSYPVPSLVGINHAGIGDFNGDGRNDIVTAGTYPGDTSSAYFYIFIQNTQGLMNDTPIQVPFTHLLQAWVTALAVADMNGDGLADIVIGTDTDIYIYYQTPSHSFMPYPRGHYAGNGIDAVRIADIDGDGFPDIAMSLWTESYIRVMYGSATQDSFSVVDYPSTASGYDDLKIGYTARHSRPSILKLCGQTPMNQNPVYPIIETLIDTDRSLITTITYGSHISGWNYSGVASGDWYGNGYHEVVASYGGNFPAEVVVWNYPDSIITTDDSVNVYDIPHCILMADLNCNGSDEVIVGHDGWDQVSVLFPTFTQAYNVPIPAGMHNDDMVIGDVSGDGRQDIVVAGTYWVSVLVNTGTFTIYMDTTITAQISSSHYDTLYAYLPPDTIIVSDLIYTIGDTQYFSDTEIVIHHNEYASIQNSVNAITVTNQCTGDSVHLIDTVNTVIRATYTDDTVIIKIYYDTVLVNGISNIGNLPNGVRIFPNPFVSGINITGLQPNSDVELYDDTGSLIFSEQCGADCFIERGNISPGVYLLKIRDSENVYTVKVSTQ